jgi:biopolymer transport protein ExbD
MAGGAQSDGDDMITAINVTPLVDIVLVLLIILMVTASYVVSKSIPMELPKSATGEATPRTISVSIDQAGSLFVDAQPVTEDALRAKVRELHKSDPDARAIIAADGRIAHAQVIRVIDLLRQENVTKFAINVRPEDVQK